MLIAVCWNCCLFPHGYEFPQILKYNTSSLKKSLWINFIFRHHLLKLDWHIFLGAIFATIKPPHRAVHGINLHDLVTTACSPLPWGWQLWLKQNIFGNQQNTGNLTQTNEIIKLELLETIWNLIFPKPLKQSFREVSRPQGIARLRLIF